MSMALVWSYILVQQTFFPRPIDEREVAKKELVEPDGEPTAAPDEAQSTKASEADDVGEPGGDASPPSTAPALASVPQQRGTLGSLAPDGSFPFLVTWNNTGASIERIELSSPRYQDLDDDSGYIGHLVPTPAEGGVRVNVVGSGTPAAMAIPAVASAGVGLRVGDILQSINGKPIQGVDSFAALMHATRPKQTIELTVEREQGGSTKQLQYRAVLTQAPLQVIQPDFQTGLEAIEDLYASPASYGPPSLRMGLARLGNRSAGEDLEIPGLPSLRTSNWEVRELDGPVPGVEFSVRLEAEALQELGVEGPLEIVKRYRLEPRKTSPAKPLYPDYHLDVQLEFRNLGEEPLELAYYFEGPRGLPLEGYWYTSKVHPSRWFTTPGPRDVAYRTSEEGHYLLTCNKIYEYARDQVAAAEPPQYQLLAPGEPTQLSYIGVDALYFAAMLMPAEKDADKFRFDEAAAFPSQDVATLEEELSKMTDVTFSVTSPRIKIAPGESFTQDMMLFAGPKDPDLLAGYKLDKLIVYGLFAWIAVGMIWVLHFFYTIVRNYGLAIVLLTVLVRGLMYPISRKAAKNAQMMQELAPEIKKINDKYKTDMEKRTQAQRELWRKHNYNPLGGCLLMFLQLPIFIGLYKALSVDIELRQAPLIPGIDWASNLAGPDKFLYWGSWMPEFLAGPTSWLGPYLNILPLVTIVLFLMHQKLFTPPATDEQTRMQQKMMKFMTIFIGVLFFKVPAGLCIYFISSSIWGIAERKLLPAPAKPNAAGPPTPPATSSRKGPGGSGPTNGSSGPGGRSPSSGSPRRQRAKRQQRK